MIFICVEYRISLVEAFKHYTFSYKVLYSYSQHRNMYYMSHSCYDNLIKSKNTISLLVDNENYNILAESYFWS